MIIVGNEREKEIAKLGFSKAMLLLCNGEYVHDDLEFRCCELKYSLEPDKYYPNQLNVIPLWEDELSITGFYKDDGSLVFIRYYVDDIDDYKVVAQSVDSLVEYLVSEFAEYDNEEQVRKILAGN